MDASNILRLVFCEASMDETRDESKQKLALCLPWDSAFMFTKFTMSALNLQHPEGYEVRWFGGRGWCPARRHADACEQAIAWGCDLLCILGADQVYEPDLLCRLIHRYEQVGGQGMIAAMVPMRGFVDWQAEMQPFQPLAWQSDEHGQLHIIVRDQGEFLHAHIIGTGVLLFHRDVYLSLKNPKFYERVDPETMHRVADMDSNFVRRMQFETGTRLYVDTTIMVKHCHVFEIDDTFQRRFADWADPATPGIDRSIVRFREELPVFFQEEGTEG